MYTVLGVVLHCTVALIVLRRFFRCHRVRVAGRFDVTDSEEQASNESLSALPPPLRASNELTMYVAVAQLGITCVAPSRWVPSRSSLVGVLGSTPIFALLGAS